MLGSAGSFNYIFELPRELSKVHTSLRSKRRLSETWRESSDSNLWILTRSAAPTTYLTGCWLRQEGEERRKSNKMRSIRKKRRNRTQDEEMHLFSHQEVSRAHASRNKIECKKKKQNARVIRLFCLVLRARELLELACLSLSGQSVLNALIRLSVPIRKIHKWVKLLNKAKAALSRNKQTYHVEKYFHTLVETVNNFYSFRNFFRFGIWRASSFLNRLIFLNTCCCKVEVVVAPISQNTFRIFVTGRIVFYSNFSVCSFVISKQSWRSADFLNEAMDNTAQLISSKSLDAKGMSDKKNDPASFSKAIFRPPFSCALASEALIKKDAV